jgi:hypothetical protein
MQPNWTNVFAKYFRMNNAVCNTMFHRHRVNKFPLRTGSSYITAEAYCARLRCTAYYFIYESPSIRTSSYRLCHVRPMPHELENISNGGLLITIVNNTDFFRSRASSVISHEKGEVFKRPVAFNLKSEALEELKDMKANEYNRKLTEKADTNLLNVGYFDDVQSKKKWRVIRYLFFLLVFTMKVKLKSTIITNYNGKKTIVG